jgi:hypothetical protein
MRTATLLATLLVTNRWAADAPTFDEVVARTQAYATDPEFMSWASETLKPFVERNFESSVSPCLSLLEGREVALRFVVEVRERDSLIHVQENPELRLSACISNYLRGLKWPVPPTSARYLPLTLNLRSPTLPADSVINELAPSNKSLERTRER